MVRFFLDPWDLQIDIPTHNKLEMAPAIYTSDTQEHLSDTELASSPSATFVRRRRVIQQIPKMMAAATTKTTTVAMIATLDLELPPSVVVYSALTSTS